jgi:hypothetical protein
VPEKGVSWDFDADESPTALKPVQGSEQEAARRPRTVTFESSTSRPLSVATTEAFPSTGTAMIPTTEHRTIDSFPEDIISSQSSTSLSSHTGEKPARKSRFVIEDSSTASSPAIHPTPEVTQSIPVVNVLVPVPVAGQAGQNLQGLGVSHGTSELAAPPEVRKGRFSVKDTSSGVTSPIPSSIKTMPGELLMLPSRSLSSSPVEGTPDGVRIGTPLELPLPSGMG